MDNNDVLDYIEKEKTILKELDLGSTKHAYQSGYIEGIIKTYELMKEKRKMTFSDLLKVIRKHQEIVIYYKQNTVVIVVDEIEEIKEFLDKEVVEMYVDTFYDEVVVVLK